MKSEQQHDEKVYGFLSKPSDVSVEPIVSGVESIYNIKGRTPKAAVLINDPQQRTRMKLSPEGAQERAGMILDRVEVSGNKEAAHIMHHKLYEAAKEAKVMLENHNSGKTEHVKYERDFHEK